jgi:hypothetical protein
VGGARRSDLASQQSNLVVVGICVHSRGDYTRGSEGGVVGGRAALEAVRPRLLPLRLPIRLWRLVGTTVVLGGRRIAKAALRMDRVRAV